MAFRPRLARRTSICDCLALQQRLGGRWLSRAGRPCHLIRRLQRRLLLRICRLALSLLGVRPCVLRLRPLQGRQLRLLRLLLGWLALLLLLGWLLLLRLLLGWLLLLRLLLGWLLLLCLLLGWLSLLLLLLLLLHAHPLPRCRRLCRSLGRCSLGGHSEMLLRLRLRLLLLLLLSLLLLLASRGSCCLLPAAARFSSSLASLAGLVAHGGRYPRPLLLCQT